jgi:hypothetical protein
MNGDVSDLFGVAQHHPLTRPKGGFARRKTFSRGSRSEFCPNVVARIWSTPDENVRQVGLEGPGL